MSKHTPGPWSYGHNGRIFMSDVAKYISVAKVMSPVANQGPKTKDEMHANGLLIATAPDLLETCKWVLGCIENSGPHHSDLISAQRELIAVIAQAERKLK